MSEDRSAPKRTPSGLRRRVLTKIRAAAAKVGKLPSTSCIRHIAEDDYLARAKADASRRDAQELLWGVYDPLTLFLMNRSLREIRRLDTDIDLVRSASTSRRKLHVIDFLRARGENPDGDRCWYAGLFETHIKATLLRKFGQAKVQLDARVEGSNRDVDAEVCYQGRRVCFEATVLSGSNEDRRRFRQILENVKSRQEESGLEKVDFQQFRRRFFAKVYDKLSPELNPNRCQFPVDCPNVLVLSIPDPTTPLSVEAITMSSAVDDLLYCGGGNSLHEWLRQRAVAADVWDNYLKYYQELVRIPGRITGLFLYGRHRLIHSRLNYNADYESHLSHADMAVFDKVFGKAIPY
jgi:hypothetical protein